jgi:glucose/arabinose dehydrogenase
VARLLAGGSALLHQGIILADVPARGPAPSASVRFGPDGKLYVAFGSGDDLSAAEDLASFRGKVLRLNTDGTTPRDQPVASPVHASGLDVPRGMDWHSPSGVLWVVDGSPAGNGSLTALVRESPEGRGVARGRYDLPPGSAAGAVAFHRGGVIPELRGNLLVAADGDILRLRLDAADPTKVVGTERLLSGTTAKVSAVAVGPDGAVYFCIGDTLARMVRRR